MSKENSKRLYEHYIKINKNKAAENMLAKYPEFKEQPKVIDKVVKKDKYKKSE